MCYFTRRGYTVANYYIQQDMVILNYVSRQPNHSQVGWEFSSVRAKEEFLVHCNYSVVCS